MNADKILPLISGMLLYTFYTVYTPPYSYTASLRPSPDFPGVAAYMFFPTVLIIGLTAAANQDVYTLILVTLPHSSVMVLSHPSRKADQEAVMAVRVLIPCAIF